LPAGGLAGLVGTRVQVWLTSNRPLSGGAAEISGAGGVSATALTPPERGDGQAAAADSKDAGPAHEVTGTFELREPGKVRCSVTDVAGQPSRENLSTTIVILPDQRPFVRLTQPQQLSFATPDFALPVAVAAEDDYGVARVQLFRSLNNSRPLPTDLVAFAPGPPAAPARRVNEATRLPLDRYGLRGCGVMRLLHCERGAVQFALRGACGCGTADTDSNQDGTPDCLEAPASGGPMFTASSARRGCSAPASASE